jgi:hypothetical protein
MQRIFRQSSAQRGCFVLESKQFQAAKAAASQLELAAQEAGVIEKKKSSQPVRRTPVTRQMMASCSRSDSTSTGRILLAAPEVNGNWQMKMPPNISAQ